jgi:hypothetical protein
MLLRPGFAALSLALALTLFIGFSVPAAQADQTIPNPLKRIFAPGNSNLDIDGVDDNRVDANVAIMDTGIELSDPDLNIVDGVDCRGASAPNYTCDSSDPEDGDITNHSLYGSDHGTWAARRIGALDNSIGFVGVAPGARIWSLAIADQNVYQQLNSGANVTMDLGAMLGALKWAIATRNDADPTNDIDVLTTLVGPECPPTPDLRIVCPGGITGSLSLAIEAAAAEAADEGIVLVRSSGNGGQNISSHHLFDSNGDKNYILASSVVDTDGLPGGLGPTGNNCGGILADGGNQVADDHNNPGSGFGTVIDLASPGTCGSESFPWVAGAAAVLASSTNPDSRADVDVIRDDLVDAGNFGWTDDSGDGIKEPLLDVGDEGVFEPVLVHARTVRHVFYRGSDDQLREWWFSDTGEWNPVGHGLTGAMGGDPAALITDDGRRFVYYRAANGQLSQYWFDNNGQSGHSGWGYANHMAGTPAAVTGTTNRRHVYYRSSDDQLREWWFSDTGEWNPVGHGAAGEMGGDPAAVVANNGRRYVYYRGTNGQLNQYWFDNNGQSGHSGWGNANHMAGTPAVVIGRDGRRHVYYRSADGQLREWWFSDTGEWNPVGHGPAGAMAGDPAVSVTPDGRRFVFYRATNGQLHQYWFDDNGQSGHSGWGYAGQMIGNPGVSLSEHGRRRWTFYQAGNGQLTQWWFRDTGEWNPAQWGYANHVNGDPAVVTRLAGY